MKNTRHLSSLAAVMMIVSSATLAAHYDSGQDGRKSVSSEKATLWHVHANGCAEGNMAPPGTNCSR
jgi:hypothetical protein